MKLGGALEAFQPAENPAQATGDAALLALVGEFHFESSATWHWRNGEP
jgi:hypothetical protein